MADRKNIKAKALDLYREGEENETLRKALEMGVKYFDLRRTEISDDTLAILSKEEAERFRAVPVYNKNKNLIIGSTNPEGIDDLINSLKKYFKSIEKALISKPSLESILPRYKNIKKIDFEKREDTINVDIKINTFSELEERLENVPIQDLLKIILSTALETRATDIHIEPGKEEVIIRFRIDGVLHKISSISREKYNYLLSQIELRSGLKLGASYAQQGRFDIKHEEKILNVRVETIPTLYGDDIAIRLFQTQTEMLKLQDLGILEEEYHIIKESILRPHGIILVTGPTGSGKTSTIYAILNELNTPEVKIITLEDPVEYFLPGATQSQINAGENFGERLKAVLREDPDIIMVGEIRDEETAKVALQAALTGHLLLSTAHANNAVTAIIRMIEFTEDASTLTASLNLLIAQRLVRKICDFCRKEYEPSEEERKEAERILNTFKESERDNIKPKFFKGEGCPKCNGIGFRGRIGIFEFLQMTSNLQKLIKENSTIFELQKEAIENGMLTMEQDGLIKVSRGITTISEVIKAVKE